MQCKTRSLSCIKCVNKHTCVYPWILIQSGWSTIHLLMYCIPYEIHEGDSDKRYIVAFTKVLRYKIIIGHKVFLQFYSYSTKSFNELYKLVLVVLVFTPILNSCWIIPLPAYSFKCACYLYIIQASNVFVYSGFQNYI